MRKEREREREREREKGEEVLSGKVPSSFLRKEETHYLASLSETPHY